jgi:signal transduction histidine kinase/CheY-like chemotaxis protein
VVVTLSRAVRALVAALGITVLTAGAVAATGAMAAGYALAGAAFIATAAGFGWTAAGLGGAVLLAGLVGLAGGGAIEPSVPVLVLTGAALALGPGAHRVSIRLSLALTGAVIVALGAIEVLQVGHHSLAAAGIASGAALLVAHAAAPRWPLGLGLAGIFVAALLWQGLAARERVLVQGNIAASLNAIERETNSELEARVLALVRIGSRWALEGMPSRDAFDLEASLNYAHFPGYQVIGWVDPGHVIRWTWPLEGNEAAVGLDLDSEPRRRAAILAAASARAPRFTLPIMLRQGGSGFLIIVPVGDPNARGFVYGGFHTNQLFDRVLGNIAYGYGVRLTVEDEIVYERPDVKTRPSESTFLLGGLTWRVAIFPPRSLLVGSSLPEAMFAAAALLSILLALAIHFALVARGLAGTLEVRIDTAVKERQHAENALRQSQKMESIGQLTGGIAHDFNNMLTVISGNLELLAGKVQSEKRLLRLVESAAAASERGERLTAQLLAFSRRQQLDPQPLDLNEVVAEMEDLLDRTVGDRVNLALSLAPDLRPAMVDRNQVEAAVLNLVLNARAATPEMGRIEVRTANARGDFVELSVADTGHGMSEEVRARAFEPFFTTKERGKGTGLGLSMVYGFVQQSGGEVHIESAEGVGTVIRLLLPIATETTRPEEESVPATARGHGETVLCVEDQEDVLDFAAETLQGLGYRVLKAGSADAALEILVKPRDGAVDLVFTDVMMPGSMDGTEFAKLVRGRWPKLPVLITSGYAERQVARESPFPFLRKPYRAATLAVAVRATLRPNEPTTGAGSS